MRVVAGAGARLPRPGYCILGPTSTMPVADTYSTGRGEKMAWYSSATMVGRFLARYWRALIFGNDFHWVYRGGRACWGIWHSSRRYLSGFPKNLSRPTLKGR